MAKHMEIDGKKIIIAESYVIEDYDDIAREFLDKIFHESLDSCLITDESQLYDFAGCCAPENYEPDPCLHRKKALRQFYEACDYNMVKAIKKEYGLDVEPYEQLIHVFEKIRQSRKRTIN